MRRSTDALTAPSALLLTAVLVALGGCRETRVIEGFPDEFVGVGVELKVIEGYPRVEAVIAGSPAAEVGLQRGDRLTQVAGVDAHGKTLGEVVRLLRGPAESQVAVQVARDGGARPLTVVMRRRAMRRGDEGAPENYQVARKAQGARTGTD